MGGSRSDGRVRRARRTGMRRVVGALAACLVFLSVGSVVAATPAGATSYRTQWTNLDPNYPSCWPYGDPQIVQLDCLPDNVAPTADSSLVYGRFVYTNGSPVQDYQYQGPAAIGELGYNGADPYTNSSRSVSPVWDGYFAFIQYRNPNDPTNNVNSMSTGGQAQPWIFQSSYLGFATPFGGDGHPSDPTQLQAPVVDTPIDYGNGTNLGTIVIPSPPAFTASCTNDQTKPIGAVTCAAQNGSGATDSPAYSWAFSDNPTSPVVGANPSYQFAGGAGSYTATVTADDGNGWTSSQQVNVDPDPCGGSCLGINTTLSAPTLSDGNQHVIQGNSYTVTAVVNNNDTIAMQNLTPGPLGGSPSTVISGPSPASVDALAPGQSTTFTWVVSFSSIDSNGSTSSLTTSSTATEGVQTDSLTDSPVSFLTDVSGLTVKVKGPSTNPVVGSLVPFSVTVTNQSGNDMTGVGPTNAALLLTQVDQLGNHSDGTIDFSVSAANPNPIPVPDLTLANGASDTFIVNGLATKAGVDTVDVSATGTNPDQTTTTNDGTAKVTVVDQQPQPPAGFTVSVVPPNPTVGQPFTVYANVTNNSLDQTGTELLNINSLGNTQMFPSVGLSSNGIGTGGISIPPGATYSLAVDNATATVAGTYNIVSYMNSAYATDTNSTSATADGSVTVGPVTPLQPQSITFTDPLPTFTFGDPLPTVTPTASSGLPVQLVSGTPSVCTVSGVGTFTITPLTAGTCAVEAQQAGDGTTWDVAAPVDRSFTVVQTPQTITFPALPAATVTDTGLTAGATSSSGLAVTFTSSTPSVCAVSTNGALSFTYYGTCTIQANQAGNTTTAAAPPVSQSFAVAPSPAAKTQAITFVRPLDMTYGSEGQPVAATAPGGAVSLSVSGTSSCNLSGSSQAQGGGTLQIPTSGNCTITATQAGDGITWLAAPPVSYTITVNPAPLTVTAPTLYAHAGDSFSSWPVTSTGWVYYDGPGRLGGYEVCTGPFTPSSYPYVVSGAPGVYPTTCTGFGATGYQVTEAPGAVTILAAGTPDPPTAVTAQAGVDQAPVSWTAPTGGADSYTVVATPGGASCTATAATGCTVTGLTAGTAYTFAVTSTLAGVTGPASAPSAPVLITAVAPGSGTSNYGGTATGQTTAGAVALNATLNADGQAPGAGTLTVSPFASDPVGTYGTNGSFFLTTLTPAATWSDIEMYVCQAPAGSQLDWWNPTTQSYVAVSPGPVLARSAYESPSQPACNRYTFTAGSSPTLQQLQDAVFAVVTPTLSAPTSVAVAGPSSIAAGSSYAATATAAGADPAVTYSLATGAPTWLSVDPGTGALSGTVPATGTTSFTYAVTATNSQGFVTGPSQTVTVTQALSAPTSVTVTGPASMVAGTSYAATATAAGADPAVTYSLATGAPTWLSVDPTTGALSGTVPATGTTSFTYAVTATNSQGSVTSPSQTVTVTAPLSAPTSVTVTGPSTVVAGTTFAATVTAAGANPAVTFSLAGGAPAWLVIDPSTGAVTGPVPFTGTTSFTFAVTATNSQGSVTSTTHSVTVAPDLTLRFTSGASATFPVSSPFSFTVTVTGSPTPKITESGSLPTGVTLVDNKNGTATISGQATASGVYPVTIKAGNSASKITQSFVLTVSAVPVIKSKASATFVVGTAGSFTVKTTGVPKAAISETSALPAGITFVDNGNGTATVSGTATESGTFPVALRAKSPAGTATQTLTLTVEQGPSITSVGSAGFVVGSPGSFTVTTSGYPAAVVKRTGTLPKGVTLVSNSDGTATLAGTPAATSAGTYTVTLTAKNKAGSVTQTFTVVVATVVATVGTPLDLRTIDSTSPKVTQSVAGVLPAGIGFFDNHNGSFSLIGTPQPGSTGIYPLTVTVTNGKKVTTQAVVIVVG